MLRMRVSRRSESPARRTVFVAGVLLPAAFACGQTPLPIAYPPGKRVDVVDDYHGVKVPDPYRWLEDPSSAEVQEWINAQNRVTLEYLARIPVRHAIRARLERLMNYDRCNAPSRHGDRYFFLHNTGLQRQSVLYVADSLDAEPRVLIDPNTLSKDGTVALTALYPSHDGSLLAYGISVAGSDWQEYRVRDVATARDRPDRLEWIKFSRAAWTHDSAGFYYARYDKPPPDARYRAANYFQKLCYHRLGTPQSEDRLVYHRPDRKEWHFDPEVTDDGRYLVVTITHGTERKSRIYYQNLRTNDYHGLTPLLDNFDAGYWFIDNDGPIWRFHTDQAAPRGRIVAIDIRHPQANHWTELVPEMDAALTDARSVGGRLFVTYLENACSRVRLFDLRGQSAGDVPLPGLGTAGGFTGRRRDRETFYTFSSFNTPPVVYRYDVRTATSAVFRKPVVDFDPNDYETTQVFCTSRDGTRVPLFITARKGLRRDGSNPTCLYGYGGFSVSITPWFHAGDVAWMELGGIAVKACIRGGGEYGKAWHEAGRLKNKQNSFDDFLAAAEWLIANRLTRSARLAISGSSNGGLLVAACMTQRPDLFGAALPAVGVMDMLRFHRYTVGWAWIPEYGSPDDPEMFAVLRAYSPLHNIRPGTAYPATMIETSDHDDRVVPAHSFKFAAALQDAQAGSRPILLRVDTRAGHGGGKPLDKVIDELADRLAFLTRALEMDTAPFVARSARTQSCDSQAR